MTATVSGWIAYAAARGITVADDTLSSEALTRALDYITYNYVSRLLPGYDATLAVVDLATYEAAKIELDTPNFFTKTFTPDQRKVLTEVKGIKWTVPTGAGSGGFGASVPVSTKIEAMFDPYISKRDGPYFGFSSIGSTVRT